MTETERQERDRFLQAFGEVIRGQRTTRRWTQEDLAERAGMHRTFVGALERGDHGMNLDRLPALARALEVQPHELFPEWDAFADREDNPLHLRNQRNLQELLDDLEARNGPVTQAELDAVDAELRDAFTANARETGPT